MKKIIITITILSFLNLIGCYYQEQMNPTKYNFDEEEDLQLTTKDTTYNIGAEDYYLENDTLFATLSKKLDKEITLKTIVEIPVANIKSVEVERTDVPATVLTVIGIGIGIAILIIAILMSNPPIDFPDS